MSEIHVLIWLTLMGLVVRTCFLLPFSRPCHPFIRCNCTNTDVDKSNWTWYPSVECQSLNLTYIPIALDVKLVTLNLTANWLTSFSLPSGLYPSLASLDLSHNSISSLDFSECLKLRRLDLSWNQLKKLNATVFRGLNSLVDLSLSHNQLALLQREIFLPVPGIISLHLSGNILADFDFMSQAVLNASDVEPFHNLEKLILSHNKLMHGDYELCSMTRLPALTFLDISGSNVRNLSCLLQQGSVPSIKYLLAVGCGLSHWNLDVFAEEVSIVPGGSLVYLDLAGNRIPSLDYTDSLRDKLFQSRNVTLILSDNPIACDCNFFRLYRFMGDRFNQVLRGVSCLSSATQSADLSLLQSHCVPAAATYVFPLIVSLLVILLLLGCGVVLLLYCKQKKAQKSYYGGVAWKRAAPGSVDYEGQNQSCLSQSTNQTNPSPELDVKLMDLPAPDSEEELENIYATIDECYVNREHIHAAKLQPVTQL